LRWPGRPWMRIIRLAFVYGEGDPHLQEGVQWLRNWNPMQKIHMVHHADVAQAIMLAGIRGGSTVKWQITL
jgi:hypothetical protein